MTQNEAVFMFLNTRSEAGLTPLEALEWIGCLRLGARIAEIKATLSPDQEIVNLWYTTPGGARVARYVLRHRAPVQQELAL